MHADHRPQGEHTLSVPLVFSCSNFSFRFKIEVRDLLGVDFNVLALEDLVLTSTYAGPVLPAPLTMSLVFSQSLWKR